MFLHFLLLTVVTATQLKTLEIYINHCIQYITIGHTISNTIHKEFIVLKGSSVLLTLSYCSCHHYSLQMESVKNPLCY